MNKTKIMKILAVFLAISLSACTVKPEPKLDQPTEEEVVAALTDELNVDGTTTVLSKFKLISHATEGIVDDVLTSFTLKAGTNVFELKASMRFMKIGEAFKLYNVDYETLSAQVSAIPDPNAALRIMQTNIDLITYNNFWFSETQMTGPIEPMVCSVVDQNFQDGATSVDCVDTLKLLDMTGKGTTRFAGKYDFKKGWVFTGDTWSYVETVEFSKPMTFKFQPNMSTEAAAIFQSNETITLTLTGKVVVSYLGTETRSVDNTMSGTLDRNGTLTPITVDVGDSDGLYQIIFSFGARPEEVLFLKVDSGGGRCGPSAPPTYYLMDTNGNYASWITDELTQSGGSQTMSETECGA